MNTMAWWHPHRILVLSLALIAFIHPASAEEVTVKAFSVWQGSGHLFQTDVDEATFVGVIAGILYVESDKGPIAMGDMTCPATVNMKTKTGAQLGNGRCVIVGDDGSRVFAEIACDGVYLVGCRGDFTIVGGDGRFAGISGGGPVLIRSDLSEVAKTSMGSLEQVATGILYLPAVAYSIP